MEKTDHKNKKGNSSREYGTAKKGETMYMDVFNVKEVNAYYDRKGGRTASIANYANAGSFAALMRQAAARRNAEVSEASAEESVLTTRPNATARLNAPRSASAAAASRSTATAHTQETNGKNDAGLAASTLNTAQSDSNICCEQCHETTQLMLQMMTKNLYTQSALGYPLTGVNAWTAYQSMAGMLGSSLFS